MATFKCLHCGIGSTKANENPKIYHMTKETMIASKFDYGKCLEVEIAYCENCEKESVVVRGVNGYADNRTIGAYPFKPFTVFPEYVPQAIRNDYEEACQIVELSPKAAATLARRCMQAMIHDCWGIDKGNLCSEIEALPDSVPIKQKQALHNLRKVGNIGAHMKISADQIMDISLQDAETLIHVVEFLIREWYVNAHETDELLSNLNEIANR